MLEMNVKCMCLLVVALLMIAKDCFERIALGAMLPFEKTFRNSDTNSLKICETLCLNDKECQTFAFGISGRGNGTCQLSANVIDATNSRPVGTIFDPDFDLYARKYNCFLDTGGPSNPPPRPGLGTFPASELPPGGTQRPTSSFPPSSGAPERPGPPVFTPTGTTATGEPISSTSNGGGFSETRPTSEYPGTFSTSVGTTFGQSTGETVQETTAPDEEYYTTHQQPSSTLTGHYTPTTSTASGSPITTGADRIPSKQPPPTMPAESPTKYPLDLRPAYPGSSPARPVSYPNYQFPMLYETNYPMPNNNERQPDIYAQNIPSLDNNYLRPEYAGYFGHRPSGPSAPTGNMKPVDNTISSYGGTGPQRPIENKPSGYGGGPLRPSGSGSGPSSSGYVTRPPPVGPSGSDGYKVTEDKPDLHPSKYRPDALKCYRCNSYDKIDCLDESDSNNDTKNSTKLRSFLHECEPDPTGQNREPFCRKISVTIMKPKHHRVIRDCGYERSHLDCYVADNDGHLETVCQCWSDQCNGAERLTSGVALGLAVMVAILRLVV